ncbi:hypothetical protein ES705_06351 [subsurface metagenome]|nr:hypothetical protein [Clostridia bacterium]
MIGERKKKEIKSMIRDYKRLLNLGEYRITSRFKTTREDNDLKGCYALVYVDNPNKNIYLRFSTWDSIKMNRRELRKLVLHELLHSFFWELSDLFSATIDKCKITHRQKELLKDKYDNMENRKIGQLRKIIIKLERQRAKRIIKEG